jgi:3-dehydroquinate synthase II
MKFFWVDAREGKNWDERKPLITTALECGARGIWVRPGDLEKAERLGSVDWIVEVPPERGESPSKMGGEVFLVGPGGEGDSTLPLPPDLEASRDLQRLRELKKEGKKTCGYVEIHSKGHERLAALEAKIADAVLVVGKDWTIIPLENLIAELQKEKAPVLAGARSASEAEVALQTLEVGVDGVLLQNPDSNEVRKVAKLLQETSERLPLKAAEVKRLQPVRMGDRVCIDTASLLEVGEGMLVGSQANGLFLIHSESLETEYVSSRPFRVNAGPVHAYVLAPDGKTPYLSDLKAGDEVLAVDKDGNTRRVVIGRLKIEKRPLLLLEAEWEGKVFKTLLQNAETIMLVSEEGQPVSVSQLKEGDKVLLYVKEGGRHFGMEVEESLIER